MHTATRPCPASPQAHKNMPLLDNPTLVIESHPDVTNEGVGVHGNHRVQGAHRWTAWAALMGRVAECVGALRWWWEPVGACSVAPQVRARTRTSTGC